MLRGEILSTNPQFSDPREGYPASYQWEPPDPNHNVSINQQIDRTHAICFDTFVSSIYMSFIFSIFHTNTT